MPRRGVQAALSPAHIGPAPDPEDWWSYKDNLQGNFVPGAARAGTQESGLPGASFLRPRSPLLSGPRSPSPFLPSSLPPESGPASEPQQLTMGHYKCAFQVVSGSEWKEGAWGCKRERVCGVAGKKAGRSGCCWEPEVHWPGPLPCPAFSCNSSPRYIHHPAVGQGRLKELQLPWALGQAGCG